MILIIESFYFFSINYYNAMLQINNKKKKN